MRAPHDLSLVEIGERLRRGALSIPDLVDALVARRDAVDEQIHAWAFCQEYDVLRKEAESLQDRLSGSSNPLFGIPFAAKDLMDTADLPTEAGSAVLAGRRPTADAECIASARRQGGLLLGKVHTHEFAFGVRTPQTNNPWDTTRTPGGSSGGSAAAVASGTTTWAFGTDTLGSVRMPAAMCGVVGLKPTLGSVSTQGVIPLSPTLDCVGFLSKTVADAQVLFEAFAKPSARGQDGREVLRIGVMGAGSLEPVEDDVQSAYQRVVEDLSLEHRIVEVALGKFEEPVQIGFQLLLPEASAWHRQYLRTPHPPYEAGILASLRSGLQVVAVDYIRALEDRVALQRRFQELFEVVDLVITPTTPYLAPPAALPEFTWPDGTKEAYETSMCRYTALASVAGLPAISVPVGTRRNLPVSVQLIGPPDSEGLLIRLAQQVEVVLPVTP